MNDGQQLLQRHRHAEIITLDKLAFFAGQDLKAGPRLNSFSNHIQIKTLCQMQNGLDNRQIRLVLINIGYQAAVDLDRSSNSSRRLAPRCRDTLALS